jgi:ribonuclease VapC
MLMEGIIGAANWSEVLQKTRQHGVEVDAVAMLLATFGLTVVEVNADDAERAQLWRKGSGFSLADRLCLALGLRLAAPVATADARWAGISDGPQVLVVR